MPGPARADRGRPAERPLRSGRVASRTRLEFASRTPARAGRGASSSVPTFELPERLEAAEPPEARGLARDEVRLLVASRRRRLDRARRLPRPARAPRRRATCSSSTARPRCPRRSSRGGPAARSSTCTSRRPCRCGDAGRWVVELRRDGRRLPAGARGRAPRAARRRPRGVLGRAVPRRRGCGSPSCACRSAAGRPTSPRHGAPDPLRPRAARLAARRLPDGVRGRAGQRRDAERRRGPSRRACSTRSPRAGVRRRVDRPAHRRLLARARRGCPTPSASASPPPPRGAHRARRAASSPSARPSCARSRRPPAPRRRRAGPGTW